MSFGMNNRLYYFSVATDGEAVAETIRENGEYCVRLRGWKGPTKYTVLPIGWNT